MSPTLLPLHQPAAPLNVEEGVLDGGLPYLAVGQGPPLVVLSGFSAEHANPTGAARRFALRPLLPLARQFTVHLITRKPGLLPGTTMRDLAGHYAHALERAFTGPVAVAGISTGGSIAQQLAIDHPHLIARLVLAATTAGGRLYAAPPAASFAPAAQAAKASPPAATTSATSMVLDPRMIFRTS